MTRLLVYEAGLISSLVFYKKNFIKVQLISNVVFISAVPPSDSVIHICVLFHILFHYGLPHDIEHSSLCYTVGPCCLYSHLLWYNVKLNTARKSNHLGSEIFCEILQIIDDQGQSREANVWWEFLKAYGCRWPSLTPPESSPEVNYFQVRKGRRRLIYSRIQK